MSFRDFCSLKNGKAGPDVHVAGKGRVTENFKVILSYIADVRPALPTGDLKTDKQDRKAKRQKVGRTEHRAGVRGVSQEKCLGSLYCLFFRDLILYNVRLSLI